MAARVVHFAIPAEMAARLDPSEVREAAEVIRGIDEAELRRRYGAIDEDSYCFQKSEDDFQYTWSWFVPLQAFFQRVAESGRWAVFCGRPVTRSNQSLQQIGHANKVLGVSAPLST